MDIELYLPIWFNIGIRFDQDEWTSRYLSFLFIYDCNEYFRKNFNTLNIAKGSAKQNS